MIVRLQLGIGLPITPAINTEEKSCIQSSPMISSNVCAARIIQEVGIRSVIQLARVLGITTPLEYDYTISLGSNGVKCLNL